MGAAVLCAEAGIFPAVTDNQAAYIRGWVAKLRSDKRLVVVVRRASPEGCRVHFSIARRDTSE
jgi:antirestriction protein ArdC